MTAPSRGPDLRILLHALDRTGPPMLGSAIVRWMAHHRPDASLEVLAFRGGPLEEDLARHASVRVVLAPHEPWDVRRPRRARRDELVRTLADLAPARANVLVSVAAAQVLPLLGPEIGPIATWSVEIGDDLHWVDAPLGLVERTDRWLAGSQATRRELVDLLPAVEVAVVDEFVDDPRPWSARDLATARRQLGAEGDEVVVLGAGIGTPRKGMDLFAEVAALCTRAVDDVRFAWIGGTDDPLHPLVAADARRLAPGALVLLPPVADLGRHLAAADVFLHTARRDAFPLVCVSAAAAATPVVAFRGTGGLEEMLGADLVGAPFPAVDELAQAVLDLREDDRRRRVGEAQQQRARRHLASAAVPRLVTVLDQVAAPA